MRSRLVFKLFNQAFRRRHSGYAWTVGWLLRLSVVGLVVYGGLLFLTYLGFTSVPIGFVPPQDKGYLVIDLQLPDASSLERTMTVMAEADRITRGDPKDKEKYPASTRRTHHHHSRHVDDPEREWIELRPRCSSSSRSSSIGTAPV